MKRLYFICVSIAIVFCGCKTEKSSYVFSVEVALDRSFVDCLEKDPSIGKIEKGDIGRYHGTFGASETSFGYVFAEEYSEGEKVFLVLEVSHFEGERYVGDFVFRSFGGEKLRRSQNQTHFGLLSLLVTEYGGVYFPPVSAHGS